MIAAILIVDKVRKNQIFEKTFLLANINKDIALDMTFFTLNNKKIYFLKKEQKSRLYTTIEPFLTTKQFELV